MARRKVRDLFTVVIPLYNKVHTIGDTLNSVLAQSFTYFEVVIVNDGSTDCGAALIDRHFDDPRIRLLDQPHGGVSVARNLGVSVARHELIAFLDGDDIWLPGYLETMSKAIAQFPNAGMYCCAGFTLHPDGSGYARTSKRHRRVGEVEFFANPDFYVNSSSAIVRKSQVLLSGGFPIEMTHGEDTVFFAKLALQAPVVFCPALLTIYRKGIEGQASENGCHGEGLVIDRSNRIINHLSKFDLVDRDSSAVDFLMFDLRQILERLIRDRQDSQIAEFFAEVEPALLRFFTRLERSASISSGRRLAALLYLRIRKLWRRIEFHPSGKYWAELPGLSTLDFRSWRTQIGHGVAPLEEKSFED